MRTISAEILERIQSLNQTAWNNANPMMQAIVVKAIRNLDTKTIRSGKVGSIDISAKIIDDVISELWIISVVDGAAVVNVYTYADDIDYTTPDSTFTLATEESEAKVRDVAISFDGTDPWLFWVERGVSYDKIFALQWNGVDPAIQPAAEELLSVAR